MGRIFRVFNFFLIVVKWDKFDFHPIFTKKKLELNCTLIFFFNVFVRLLFHNFDAIIFESVRFSQTHHPCHVHTHRDGCQLCSRWFLILFYRFQFFKFIFQRRQKYSSLAQKKLTYKMLTVWSNTKYWIESKKDTTHLMWITQFYTCTPGLSGKVTYTKCVYRRESNWVVPTHVRYTRSQLYSSGMVSRVVLLDTHTQPTITCEWLGWLLCEKNFLFQIFSQWVSGKCVCVRLRRS